MERATPLAHNGYKVGLFETAIYREPFCSPVVDCRAIEAQWEVMYESDEPGDKYQSLPMPSNEDDIR